MINMLLGVLQNQPKFKSVVENLFGQPADHVVNCISGCFDSIRKGPGLVNTAQQKIDVFNRIYKGGLALGFPDWESELAAAKIAGYTDLDICMSFRDRHKWSQTTVEKVQGLAEDILPGFIDKAKKAGLLPPEMFPDSGIPKTEITTSGGAAPWENPGGRSGASVNPGDNNCAAR